MRGENRSNNTQEREGENIKKVSVRKEVGWSAQREMCMVKLNLNPNCSKNKGRAPLYLSRPSHDSWPRLPTNTPPSPLLHHAAPRLVAGDANRRRGVVLPLGGSTTLLSFTHRNATPRDQRRRNACNLHRERRHRRDRRASPTAPTPPSARGFLPGRSSARSSAASPSRSLRVAPPRRHRRGKRRRRWCEQGVRPLL